MPEPVSRVQIEEAARRAKLPRAAYLVLTALTARLGQNAAVWPSVATLVDDCALSRRSVQLALRRLEVAGWLVSTARTGTSTRYQIEIGQVIAGEVRPGHWRARKPWGVQHVAPVQQVAHVQHVAPQGVQHVAQGVRNTLHPNPSVNPSEEPSINTTHPPEPAQALTATPEPIARAGDEPSADEPVTIGRRAGPLGNEQQRQAALDAVADPPPPRAPINLTVHQGEPKPPPPYHVGGKVLPGTLRDLVGNAAAQVLAPHFRWDGLRSPTQKLFDAADLRFIRGLTPVFLVELALEFDRRWGLRPKGLLSVEVPWVDFGGEVADELERLHTFQRGVQPSAEQARGLIPDDARRAAFNAALKALGDGSIRDGWGVVGERVRVRLAAK